MNVAIDVESNGVLASGLDGLADIETLAVDFDASLVDNRFMLQPDRRNGVFPVYDPTGNLCCSAKFPVMDYLP